MMTRRVLLVSTALVPVAACAQLQPIIDKLPGLAKDAALIAQTVALILPTIRTLTGLSGGAWNEVNKLVAMVETTAGQIQSAVGAALPQMVQTIGAAVAGLAGTLLGVPGLPTIVSTIIGAAGALLPALEQAVGIAPALATARRFAAVLTPDQARAQLQAIAAGR